MFNERRITGALSICFLLAVLVFLTFPIELSPGSFFGHVLGMAGTLIMIFTLIYPFRKRVLGRKGRKNPLSSHISYGLIGPTLVVLHSGHELGSLIGALAFFLMFLIVLSGISGRYLYKRINVSLKDHKKDLTALKRLFINRRAGLIGSYCEVNLGPEIARPAGDSLEEGTNSARESQYEEAYALARMMVEKEQTVQAFSATKALFSRWLRAHIYLTVLLFSVVIVHVLTTIYYGLKWLP